MNILGISCFYHDSAAALIQDGRLVAAAEEERFSRIVTTVGYLVAMPLFAIGVRLFSDPLQLKPRPAQWHSLPPPPTSVEGAQTGL